MVSRRSGEGCVVEDSLRFIPSVTAATFVEEDAETPLWRFGAAADAGSPVKAQWKLSAVARYWYRGWETLPHHQGKVISTPPPTSTPNPPPPTLPSSASDRKRKKVTLKGLVGLRLRGHAGGICVTDDLLKDRRHIFSDPNYQRCFCPLANPRHIGCSLLRAVEICFSGQLFSLEAVDDCFVLLTTMGLTLKLSCQCNWKAFVCSFLFITLKNPNICKLFHNLKTNYVPEDIHTTKKEKVWLGFLFFQCRNRIYNGGFRDTIAL